MISSNSVASLGRAVGPAKARAIELHRSALTEDEYQYYTTTLLELVSTSSNMPSEEQENHSLDPLLESKVITLREARAWLRGRFQSVPCEMLDEILRLFPSPLVGDKMLKGAQFFAALRLMCHAEGGMNELDRALTFKPAPIGFANSDQTTDGKTLAASLVEKSQNSGVSTTTLSQIPPVKERSDKTTASTPIVPVTPVRTPITRVEGNGTTQGTLPKLIPEKRAIDVEPAPRSHNQAQSEGNGSPAKKARRTNAGKRKSDATWDDAAAKAKGASGSNKKAALTPTTATLAVTATDGPYLTRMAIKKPTQYAASASVPMPPNTRLIRGPIMSQVAVKTVKKPDSVEGESSKGKSLNKAEWEGSDPFDSYTVPKPKSKNRANGTVDDKLARSKPDSDPGEQDSDEDPNRTKSESDAGGDSGADDSDSENDAGKMQAVAPTRPAALARRKGKRTARGKNAAAASESASTPQAAGRSKGAKATQASPDGFSRPPPNKHGAYPVRRITASRTSPLGAVELHVLWEGYPASEATWEPLAGVRDTAAHARWAAMWGRLGRKGIRDVQIVRGRKNTIEVRGRKREHVLVQAVGTKADEGRWVLKKEAEEMMKRIEQAILEDERMMENRA